MPLANAYIRHFEAFLHGFVVPLLLNCSVHGPEGGKNGRTEDYPDVYPGVYPGHHPGDYPGGGVCFDSLARLKVYLPESRDRYFTLRRATAFSYEEKDLVERVLANTRHMPDCFDSFHETFLTACIEEAVAFRLCPAHAGTIGFLLRRYGEWALEGGAEHTLGMRFGRGRAAGCRNVVSASPDLVRNLGAGPGSMLTIDGGGGILGIQNLSSRQYSQRMEQEVRAPVQMSDVALWTARGDKLAFRLTADGEIFIFKDKQLAFAKRRSRWTAFPHRSILEWCFAPDPDGDLAVLGTGVYLTALDLSLARREAALHIVVGADNREECAVSADELKEREGRAEQMKHAARTEHEALADACAARGEAALSPAELAGWKPFTEIPRKARLPICYRDEPLIIDRTGALLPSAGLESVPSPASTNIRIRVAKEGRIEIVKPGGAALRFA